MGRSQVRSRTDRHNNPIAFTTAVAKQAKLELGVNYAQGDPFVSGGKTYYTAQLLGDPVALTIRVLDNIGFLTVAGGRRWSYIEMPSALWRGLSKDAKTWVIGHMYQHEGGKELKVLFQ